MIDGDSIDASLTPALRSRLFNNYATALQAIYTEAVRPTGLDIRGSRSPAVLGVRPDSQRISFYISEANRNLHRRADGANSSANHDGDAESESDDSSWTMSSEDLVIALS